MFTCPGYILRTITLIFLFFFKAIYETILEPPGGGGGGVLTPNFGRYVPRQSEKGQGFELENARLRNELEPFWAWKCRAPERAWSVLSLKMRISGTAANPRRCRTLCVRAEPAVGGDERVEIKENFENGGLRRRQNPPKNVKWWCSGTDFLVICENDMLRNGNSGLKMGVSRAVHTQYAYKKSYGSPKYPPPPPGLERFCFCFCIRKHRTIRTLPSL